ncbi:MAG: hypothetical protein ABSG43_30340 [Solirubrobacteraceae bacterium]
MIHLQEPDIVLREPPLAGARREQHAPRPLRRTDRDAEAAPRGAAGQDRRRAKPSLGQQIVADHRRPGLHRVPRLGSLARAGLLAPQRALPDTNGRVHGQIPVGQQLLDRDDLDRQRPRDAPHSAIDERRERRRANRLQPELRDRLQLALTRTQPRQLPSIRRGYRAADRGRSARLAVGIARAVVRSHLTQTEDHDGARCRGC